MSRNIPCANCGRINPAMVRINYEDGRHEILCAYCADNHVDAWRFHPVTYAHAIDAEIVEYENVATTKIPTGEILSLSFGYPKNKEGCVSCGEDAHGVLVEYKDGSTEFYCGECSAQQDAILHVISQVTPEQLGELRGFLSGYEAAQHDKNPTSAVTTKDDDAGLDESSFTSPTTSTSSDYSLRDNHVLIALGLLFAIFGAFSNTIYFILQVGRIITQNWLQFFNPFLYLAVATDLLDSPVLWSFAFVTGLGWLLVIFGERLVERIQPNSRALNWYWKWGGTAFFRVPFFLAVVLYSLIPLFHLAVWTTGILLDDLTPLLSAPLIFTFRVYLALLPLPLVHLIWDNDSKANWRKLFVTVLTLAFCTFAIVGVEFIWLDLFCSYDVSRDVCQYRLSQIFSTPSSNDDQLSGTVIPTATREPRATSTPRPKPTVTPDYRIPIAVVESQGLNIRSGPGTNYEILNSVTAGTELIIVGTNVDESWLGVQLDSSGFGWISADSKYVEEFDRKVSANDFQRWRESVREFLRPDTSLVYTDQSEMGEGELQIENGTTKDGVAILTTLRSTPVLAAYIRKGDTYTLTGIRDGDYYLYFSTGDEWDNKKQEFTKNVQYQRFDEPFPFDTTETQYTIWEITLHPISGGNATTEEIDTDEFPELR